MNRFAAPADPLTPGPLPDAPAAGEARSPLDTSHTPFIATTEGEGGLHIPRVLPGADGWIRYATPGPFDRYPETEVLLARTAGAVPCGRPDGNVVVPYRQAHCMINRLCQGCGFPAERCEKGLLTVLPATRSDGSAAATSGKSDMPPSCARCALRYCPVLAARGRRLLWVRRAEVIGVYAEVFLPPSRDGRSAKTSHVLPGSVRGLSEQLVLFDDERTLSASVATRFVCDLKRVSDADPGHIAELARKQAARTPLAGPRACGRTSATAEVGRPV
ncbi:hypothetical protein OG215_37300 (plasmid) [Streptomyces globisporus]|uniref:hypothetical protein n=1 Tax=Streptomyces globisporus TaxID=1908 RepID=UPI002F91B993|nr:hypothetical protein OG215_37300 [Streptomyces globisporus]